MTKEWTIDRLLLHPALALEELNGRTDAEPVAAMTTDYLGCEYVSMDVASIEKIAAAGSKGPTEVVFLYAAPPAPSFARPQCCMCGKKGLSTAEGDGGTECELSDGRWVCSAECWGRAVEPAPSVAVKALGWQPIETAPRDGTQFLALLSNGWYELLRCRADADGHYEWWTALGNVSVPIVETHPKGTDWAKSHTLLATHWMPLPAAPVKD